MSKKRKILLYYCLLLSIFIPGSALISDQSLKGLIPTLLFLPVALYLIYSIKEAKTAEESKSTKRGYFIIFTVLLLLVTIGVYNSTRHPKGVKTTPGESPSPIPTLSPSPYPLNPKLIVVAEVKGGTVNIRKSPTSSSELITTVEDGDTFEYLEKEAGWYKIVLSGKETAWIKGNYVKIIEE